MDKSTFHVGGSSSQVIISSYHQQETLPLPTINMTAYLPSVSSFTATNILAFANFPLDSSQRTLSLLENLPSLFGRTLLRYILISSTNFCLSTFLPTM